MGKYPNCTHCKCFHSGEVCCWCADNIPCWQDDEDDATNFSDEEGPRETLAVYFP